LGERLDWSKRAGMQAIVFCLSGLRVRLDFRVRLISHESTLRALVYSSNTWFCCVLVFPRLPFDGCFNVSARFIYRNKNMVGIVLAEWTQVG
jgi:hypothetical protein